MASEHRTRPSAGQWAGRARPGPGIKDHVRPALHRAIIPVSVRNLELS